MRTKKNPLVPVRAPQLPPHRRSRAAHLLTAAAAAGDFVLPRCTACGRFAWPAPELCPACLSEVAMAPAPAGARLVAASTSEVPSTNYFRARAPWRVGLVQLEAGPQAIVHLHPAATENEDLHVRLVLDRAGQAVLHAAPKAAALSEDPQWNEMTCAPRDRRVLVTDARHLAALPLVQGLAKAGAVSICVGVPEAWKPLLQRDAFLQVPGVELVPLDLTSDRSVADLAHQIGGKIEILINTADMIRPGGLTAPTAAHDARAMHELVAMGLSRLARNFGPAMTGRGADGALGAAAWVNLQSVFALAAPPGLANYGAAHAAGLSLARSLRAQLGQGGVRLMTVMTGPTEDPWFQTHMPPKVGGKAIASAILSGLERGLEEVVVGDVAAHLVARLSENPKAVEREWAQGGT